MCIKTISNFKRRKKRFLKNEKKKVCDVTCEYFSQGYRFSIRLRGIGLRHLFYVLCCKRNLIGFPLLPMVQKSMEHFGRIKSKFDIQN